MTPKMKFLSDLLGLPSSVLPSDAAISAVQRRVSEWQETMPVPDTITLTGLLPDRRANSGLDALDSLFRAPEETGYSGGTAIFGSPVDIGRTLFAMPEALGAAAEKSADALTEPAVLGALSPAAFTRLLDQRSSGLQSVESPVSDGPPSPVDPQGELRVIVQLAPGYAAEDVSSALAALGGEFNDIVRPAGGPLGDGSGMIISVILPGALDADFVIETLERNPNITDVNPDYALGLNAVSDDPRYTDGTLWGLLGDQTSPANIYGSQAGEAWAAGHTGSTSTVVGITDSGIDATHPDLYLNIWLNQEEIPTDLALNDFNNDGLITFHDLNDVSNAGAVVDFNTNGYIDAIDVINDSRWANGIDDDNNGYVDDFYGWDYIDDDNNPFDGFGHGTHVSGTIGAMNDGSGAVGVAWNVQLMSLRFFNDTGGGGLVSDAIRALDYFTMESQNSPGQHFVATSNSWGAAEGSETPEDWSLLESAIGYGALADILFVTSAGNSGLDNDTYAYFPGNFDTTSIAGYDAVISVAALNSNGGTNGPGPFPFLRFNSNYGATTVDLAAPGVEIYSTLNEGGYGTKTGSSMAAPHVTGALVLYAAANPNATAAELRDILLGTTIYTASLDGRVVTDGRLDIEAMLASLTTALPGATVVSVTDDSGAVQGVLTDGAVTDDLTPLLAGALSAELPAGAFVNVLRDGTYLGQATVSGTNWSFADTLSSDGAYSYTVQVEDAGGATGSLSGAFTLTLDTAGPAVSVDTLITDDTTPALSGTIDDAGASVSVFVDGSAYDAVNNGDGTWTLADNTVAVLAEGVHDVLVTAVDAAGNEGSDATIGELQVTAPNTPPTALDDAYTVTEDAVLEGMAVLDNDSDGDGDPLFVAAIDGQTVAAGSSVTLASGAMVTLNADGTLSYDQKGAFDTLNVGETATERFIYSASDGQDISDATVTVTIDGTFDNTAPVAGDDAFSVAENGSVSGNVLDNDSDADTDPLAVTQVNGSSASVGVPLQLASGALLTLNADGTFDYDPNGAFDTLEGGETATDGFAYQVSDGQGGSDSATVTITIDGLTPPTLEEPVTIDFEGIAVGPYSGEAGLDFAGIDVIQTSDLGGARAGSSGMDGDFTVTATQGDFDLYALSLRAFSGREKILIEAYDDGVLVGSTQVNAGARKPTDVLFDATFASIDQLVFRAETAFMVDDIDLLTRTATGPEDNTPPSAIDDSYTTGENAEVSGNLMTNDSDTDGGVLSLVSIEGDGSGNVTLASGATVAFSADGSFLYNPNGAFDGLHDGETTTDSFVYEITDGQGGTDTAIASITINGIGTRPELQTIIVDFEQSVSAEDGFAFFDTQTATLDGSNAAASLQDRLSFDRNGEVFDFDGGTFGVLGRGRFDVTVTGWNGGSLVAQETLSLRGGKVESVTLGTMFDAVDHVEIISANGITVDDLIFVV